MHLQPPPMDLDSVRERHKKIDSKIRRQLKRRLKQSQQLSGSKTAGQRGSKNVKNASHSKSFGYNKHEKMKSLKDGQSLALITDEVEGNDQEEEAFDDEGDELDEGDTEEDETGEGDDDDNGEEEGQIDTGDDNISGSRFF